jgi:WD40 repeat protein
LSNANFASGCLDGSIKIWSSSSWTLIFILNHGFRVLSLALLQNKYLVSGGDGGLIKIWDFRTGKLINTFTGFSKTVRTIKVLDNDNLATGSWDDFNGRIWNTMSGTIKLTLYEPSFIFGFVQLKNGDLISISTNGNINKWDSITGSLTTTKHTGNFVQSAITELMNEDLFIGDDNGGLRIFNSTTFELKYNLIGHTNDIVRLVQLQNGDLASCSMDNSIIIWDWQSKTRKYKLTAHSNWVWGLIELPNGYLVSAGLDSKIIIWK